MNALQRGAAPALALACAPATCSMEAAVKSVTAHASKEAHNKFTMPKQRKASGDSVSGRTSGGTRGSSCKANRADARKIAKCGEASRAAQHTMYITRRPKKCDSLRLQHTMYIGGGLEKIEPNETR